MADNNFVGNWTTSFKGRQDRTESGVKLNISMSGRDNLTFTPTSFSKESTIVVDITGKGADSDDGIRFSLTMKGANKGIWSAESGVLILTPDKKSKPVIEVTSSNVPAIIRPFLVGSLKKELKAALKQVSTYDILSSSETKMVLKERNESAKKGNKQLEDIPIKPITYTKTK